MVQAPLCEIAMSNRIALFVEKARSVIAGHVRPIDIKYHESVDEDGQPLIILTIIVADEDAAILTAQTFMAIQTSINALISQELIAISCLVDVSTNAELAYAELQD